MATKKRKRSALKRIRQTQRRTQVKTLARSAARTAVRTARETIAKGGEAAAEMISAAASALVARAQRDVALAAVLRDPIAGLRVEGDLLRLADAAEDLRELLIGRRLDLDLVLDPSQERLVDERGRGAVGREDEEHVEGDLDLAAIGRGEEVHIPIERHDPAIEELLR